MIRRGVLGWLLGALLVLAAGAAAADVSPAALRSRIRAFVAERADVEPAAVSVPSLDRFDLPAGAAPVEVRLSAHEDERFDGPTPVTLRFLANGEELRRGVVTVDVTRHTRVLVAARSLRAKTVIRPEDVRAERIDADRAPRNAVRDSARLVGRRTTRAVSAGRPFRENGVSDVPAVVRGELVRIRIEQGGLRIESVGKAREDGGPGDRVRVLNVESRREVVGRVGADGVVHVSF